MFYIDFTTPEGKTYRIDLSKHKLIHSCPVCGSEQQIMLDESDPYYWCYDCRERREEQEKIEGYRRRMQENVRRIKQTMSLQYRHMHLRTMGSRSERE